MTLFYSRFEPAQLVSIHPATPQGYLTFTWTAQPDGTWDQGRPEKRPCMASAVSLVPPGAQELPAPPDFAARLFQVGGL